MSYAGVKLLAEERPEFLPLVEAAHRIVVQHGNQFSGTSVLTLAPEVTTNLHPLSRRGIVEETGGSRRGHRAFYRLVDPPGVERALRELGII
jgi:hypothetical protein